MGTGQLAVVSTSTLPIAHGNRDAGVRNRLDVCSAPPPRSVERVDEERSTRWARPHDGSRPTVTGHRDRIPDLSHLVRTTIAMPAHESLPRSSSGATACQGHQGAPPRGPPTPSAASPRQIGKAHRRSEAALYRTCRAGRQPRRCSVSRGALLSSPSSSANGLSGSISGRPTCAASRFDRTERQAHVRDVRPSRRRIDVTGRREQKPVGRPIFTPVHQRGRSSARGRPTGSNILGVEARCELAATYRRDPVPARSEIRLFPTPREACMNIKGGDGGDD